MQSRRFAFFLQLAAFLLLLQTSIYIIRPLVSEGGGSLGDVTSFSYPWAPKDKPSTKPTGTEGRNVLDAEQTRLLKELNEEVDQERIQRLQHDQAQRLKQDQRLKEQQIDKEKQEQERIKQEEEEQRRQQEEEQRKWKEDEIRKLQQEHTQTGKQQHQSSGQATETPKPTPTAEAELVSKEIAQYVKAILDPSDTSFPRLSCPSPNTERYAYLKHPIPSTLAQNTTHTNTTKPRFLFALDLFECAPLLPRLLGSIISAINFLGPTSCVLSIVEGRSTDNTAEILAALRPELKKMGIRYYIQHSNINPLDGTNDRFTQLAALRNLALTPLTNDTALAREDRMFAEDAAVVFINDISLCVNDVLELVHQKHHQAATMVCAMDYINPDPVERTALFYDVFIARQRNGDLFFNIPANISWEFSLQPGLFWNDEEVRRRYDKRLPFQVFACWNGGVVFDAAPLVEHGIRFRARERGECLIGEPTLFCKDLVVRGYGKVAVVPSVSVGYDDEKTRMVKEFLGAVEEWTNATTVIRDEKIEWKGPPEMVKCIDARFGDQRWVAWDEGRKPKPLRNF